MSNATGFPSVYIVSSALAMNSDEIFTLDDIIARQNRAPEPEPSSIPRLPTELLMRVRELLFRDTMSARKEAAAKRLRGYHSKMQDTACYECLSHNNSFRGHEDLWRYKPVFGCPSRAFLDKLDWNRGNKKRCCVNVPLFASHIEWLQAICKGDATALREKWGIQRRTNSAVWDIVAQALIDFNYGWMGNLTPGRNLTTITGGTAEKLKADFGVDDD